MTLKAFEQGSIQPVPYLLPRAQEQSVPEGWLHFTELPELLFSAVTTPRLKQAGARFLDRLTQAPAKPVAERHPPASIAPPEGSIVCLEICCQNASPLWPELSQDESYRLTITSEVNTIRLQAESEWGVLHGLETLAQLVQGHPFDWRVAILKIADHPAYPWRGLCLDLCRHWIGPEKIKALLDGMACEHLNVLHLHLSDDQAFRLALESLPSSEGQQLSRRQVEALVEYAAERAIRLVPEIDLPSHCTALLAILPELSAGPAPSAPGIEFGGYHHCLDPSNESTYRLLEKVLTEISEWFSDRYIHTGGDEVNPEIWSKNAAIKRFMKRQGLTDYQALQAYFHGRLKTILSGLNKEMVVWDEALHPMLPKDVLIQCWRGVVARDLALNAGHRTLFSSGYYLDQNYSNETHYRFDPAASSEDLRKAENMVLQAPGLGLMKALLPKLTEQVRASSRSFDLARQTVDQVLGGEACLWSELVDQDSLDSRLFSRLPAVAERLWLAYEPDQTLDNFYIRLEQHWGYLEKNTALKPIGSVRQQLERLELSAEVIGALQTLLNCLEPVKWHWRLLGEKHLKARAKGTTTDAPRPYNARTKLNRMADICLPESLLARQLAAQDKLKPDSTPTLDRVQLASSWQEQAVILRNVEHPLVTEVYPLSQRLGRLGDLLEQLALGQPLSRTDKDLWQEEIQKMKPAVAELLLVAVSPIEEMLKQRD